MQNIGNGNRSIVYDGKIAGLYDLEETLGSGHFAVVKLARHVFTGEKVAVKVIDKTKLDEVSRAHLFQEVRCMKLVQHPNVVRLYEVIDTQTKLYLILELGDGGDLYDYIMKHEGGLSENLAKEYFRQIVRAISYCHKLHVVHRDLKPENVVFFEKLGVVKLTDFGFSNKFCPGQKLETSCGSLAYSAPEILLGDSYDAPAVDIWSLGVILYMLVCGNPPFEKANDSETLTMIMDCKYTMPAHVSQGCRNLIDSMLVRAPENRATLEEIANNPWLIEGLTKGGGNQDNLPEFLPLVSREQVSDEDHATIIKKIVNGKIATKEEVLDALDRNEYNHITATYFLMAERKLRQIRLDQMQKRRPDLSLPVSSASQLSPRSRIQGIKNMQSARDANQLLVPTSSQITAPRTPGAETTTGRTRKCSIVQEEEDDEDEIPNCTKRDELMAPVNRRGSRSEGRINLAIQDKVSQNERLKLHHPTSTNSNDKGIENISGIKIIHNDANNVRTRLGKATGSGNNYLGNQSKPPPSIAITKFSEKLSDSGDNARKAQKIKNYGMNSDQMNEINTTFLTDSSTITLPIISCTTPGDSVSNAAVPKYKTMPSPTRPGALLASSGQRPLNEIFEEGTDIGSSDTSTTTTPLPAVRSAHFTTTNRSGGSNSSVIPHHNYQHRRTKFHKTKTPSCSSSDASDDDSESRKKRANKMPDITKPMHSQRRDSHDDSSDSQEPGNASGSGNTTIQLATYLVCGNSGNNGNSGDNNSNNNERSNGGKGDGNTRSESTACSVEEMSKLSNENGTFEGNKVETVNSYRRHRNGRRRASETRLRESQSLNRITEVQESELPLHIANNSQINNNEIHCSQDTSSTEIDSVVIQNGSVQSKTCTNLKNSPTAIHQQSQTTQSQITKPKGLSARIFHGFIRNKNSETKSSNATTHLNHHQQQQQHKIKPDPHSADDVDLVVGVEFTKQLRATDTSKSSSATKKLKMIGKYFQVHKKICIPLPGLFQRTTGGRLYKAQSCGSIVHNRVNQNCLNTSIAPTAVISSSSLTNTRHSVLYTATTTTTTTVASTKTTSSKGSRCLNASDINQNNDCNNIKFINDSTNNSPSYLLQQLTGTSELRTLTNSQSSSCSSIQQQQQINNKTPSTFDLMSSTSATMTKTLFAATPSISLAQNNTNCNNLINNSNCSNSSTSSSSNNSSSSSNYKNNYCNHNNKFITSSSTTTTTLEMTAAPSSSSSSTQSSIVGHHQLNDVPLCSSKC